MIWAPPRTMHKMLQEQANQIETLAFTLKKRISLHAPTDYEIKMAKKLSAVDQKLKELSAVTMPSTSR
jgi:hypothetical protein